MSELYRHYPPKGKENYTKEEVMNLCKDILEALSAFEAAEGKDIEKVSDACPHHMIRKIRYELWNQLHYAS